jgi:hypothetical protein
MYKLFAAIIIACLSVSAFAETKADVICAYAPSQSKTVTAIAGTAGGAGAATAAIGQALGLTVVAHSSGALMLSGAGGYIAGTLGTAIAAPTIVAVAILVGGTAATVEFVCAPRNHPEYVAKIETAAVDAKKRWGDTFAAAKGKTNDKIESISAKVKDVKVNAFEYIYR